MADLSKNIGISDAALTKLLEKRKPTEVSLVEIMTGLLEEYEYESAVETFTTDPSIVGIEDSNQSVQMVIINRFFINHLFRFRADNEVPVIDPLVHIQQVSEISDWSKIYRSFVIPFFKNNNIL